jgi:malonyl-CoA O-methyltransferase
MTADPGSRIRPADRLDRCALRRQRARAAGGYRAAAVLTDEVGRRLLEHLEFVSVTPAVVLDAGALDGQTSRLLSARYRDAVVVSVEASVALLAAGRPAGGWWRRLVPGAARTAGARLAADIDRLPIATGCADLVYSNLALQWHDADRAFAEASRVLRDGGLYAFSALGPDTLRELREAFGDDRGGYPHFADMHDVGDALVRAGFDAPVVDMEMLTLTYAELEDLLRDLRANGAGNAMRDRARGMLSRGRLERARRRYERWRREGTLPASFEVIYGHAWKTPSNRLAMPDGRRVIELVPKPIARP